MGADGADDTAHISSLVSIWGGSPVGKIRNADFQTVRVAKIRGKSRQALFVINDGCRKTANRQAVFMMFL